MVNTIFLRISCLGFCMALALGAAQAEVANEAWVVRYNGPGSGKDNAQALTVDAAGNAYVTGFSDSGGGNYDFATVKYDPNGNQAWVAHYDGDSQGADWAKTLSVDPTGNVLVTGSSAGKGTGFDFSTVKYDTQGKQLWVSRYDGPVHGDDRVKALTVDGTGNVYVTGDSAGTDGRAESVTLKYNPDGDLLWATRSGAAGGGDHSLSAIAGDPRGNVYVVGGEARMSGDSDYLTIKYDPNGKILWTAHRDWGANDDARYLAVDADGNTYVAGASLRYTEDPEKTAHEDIAIVKYTPDGTELWAASFNGGVGTDDVVSAMRIDPAGHVYLVGTSYGKMTDGSNADLITIKYAADGAELWSAPYQGIGETTDIAHDAALDSSGALYVLGSERGGSARKPWLVTVKFTTDGNGQWVTRHEGMATASGGALAVDDLGNVWIVGSDTRGQDYLTVKYVRSEITAEAAKR